MSVSIINPKGAKAMKKARKNRNQDITSKILLITATINLIKALIDLIEKLIE